MGRGAWGYILYEDLKEERKFISQKFKVDSEC